jgi:hypothetical protein
MILDFIRHKRARQAQPKWDDDKEEEPFDGSITLDRRQEW